MVTKRNNNNTSSNREKGTTANRSNSSRRGRKHETATKKMHQRQHQTQRQHEPQRNNYRYNYDAVDPFPSALRCRPNKQQLPMVLDWYCPRDPVPVHVEQSLIDVVLPYGVKERGMFKEQPEKRLQRLKNHLYSIGSSSHDGDNDSNDYSTNNNSNNTIICLYQALSLRRHHMKQFNPNTSMAELRLGAENDINESARIFENCIEQFLIRSNIQFYNEQYQKSHIRRNKPCDEPYPPTPDFILQEPITIRTYRNSTNGKKKMILQEHSIHWIEVKMFYGASTIPNDNRSAVGCLLTTANKYLRCHGPGAMIFMYGFGDQLGQQLSDIGILPLDCNYKYSHNDNNKGNNLGIVNLDAVISHQTTWCANKHGEVLP